MELERLIVFLAFYLHTVSSVKGQDHSIRSSHSTQKDISNIEKVHSNRTIVTTPKLLPSDNNDSGGFAVVSSLQTKEIKPLDQPVNRIKNEASLPPLEFSGPLKFSGPTKHTTSFSNSDFDFLPRHHSSTATQNPTEIMKEQQSNFGGSLYDMSSSTSVTLERKATTVGAHHLSKRQWTQNPALIFPTIKFEEDTLPPIPPHPYDVELVGEYVMYCHMQFSCVERCGYQPDDTNDAADSDVQESDLSPTDNEIKGSDDTDMSESGVSPNRDKGVTTDISSIWEFELYINKRQEKMDTFSTEYPSDNVTKPNGSILEISVPHALTDMSTQGQNYDETVPPNRLKRSRESFPFRPVTQPTSEPALRHQRSYSELVIGKTFPERSNYRSKRSIAGTCMDESKEICFCDARCFVYGDCCADIFHHCYDMKETVAILKNISDTESGLSFALGLTQSSTMAEALKSYPQEVEKVIDVFVKEFSTCFNIVEKPKKNLLLISSCSENVRDAAVKEKCERQSSHLLPPVTAIFEGGEASFRNFFCAQCHGMDEAELVMWTPEIKCNATVTLENHPFMTMQKLEELISINECAVNFEKPETICGPRSCNTDYPLTDTDEQKLVANVEAGVCTPTDMLMCKLYIYPSNFYRNPHCQNCLDTKTRKRRENKICEPIYPDIKPPRGGLLLILDITGKYSDPGGHQVASYFCEEDDVFDPLTQECKQLHCPQGYEPYRGKCYPSTNVYFVEESTQLFPEPWNELDIMIDRSIKGDSCQKLFLALKNRTESNGSNLVITSFVVRNGRSENSTLQISNVTGGLRNCSDVETDGSSESLAAVRVTLTGDLDSTVLEDLKFLAASMVPTTEDGETAEVSVTNMIDSKQAACPFNDVLKQSTEFTIEQHKDDLYAVVNSTQYQIFYPLQNIGYMIRLSWTTAMSVEVTEIAFFCERSGIFANENCTVVSYWLNETFLNGSELLVLHSLQYYKNDQFEIRDDQVFVCSDLKFGSQKSESMKITTYQIISWLFTTVSILFLLAMIVCYLLFPELCTLPGKMTASLAGTMLLTFLSNMFTLTELYNKYVCPVVAALSHLVTLAHFGWMSAIAVNMALTFGPCALNRAKPMNSKKVFIRYNIVVWGLSAVIVVISVLLDITHSDPDLFPDGSHVSTMSPLANTTSAEPEARILVSAGVSSSSSEYPRYGYPFCTWFSGPLWSRVSFVIIPYASTFLINVVCFTLTIVGIQSASKGADKLGNKSADRMCCLIYLKLSTAMGFAWILSFLTNFVDEEDVLPYIYVTLVLLQGVLLFLAFMANGRVYALITRRSPDAKKTKTTLTSISQSNVSNGKTAMA